jgi:hypothetical protein
LVSLFALVRAHELEGSRWGKDRPEGSAKNVEMAAAPEKIRFHSHMSGELLMVVMHPNIEVPGYRFPETVYDLECRSFARLDRAQGKIESYATL